MRSLLSVALLLLVGVASIMLLAWLFQRRLIYLPFGEVPTPRNAGQPIVEEVQFPTDDDLALHGWFFPNATSQSPFTVVVFNGNAGNRSFRVPLAASLHQAGLQVLLFDYRGFGGNAGSPTEMGLHCDARAVRRYVLSRPDIDASRLVYFGESLGSAVAINLAAQFPPALLIVRSPFPSLVDVGQIHYPFLPVRWLLEDRFAAIDTILDVTSPMLVIAGDDDQVIPLELSRHLFEAASAEKQFIVVDGANHNDYALLAGDHMITTILTTLRRLN